MLNDLYSTAMAGRFENRGGGGLFERGGWGFNRFGNDENNPHCAADCAAAGLGYSLTIHSAERQMDRVELTVQEGRDPSPSLTLRADMAGSLLNVDVTDNDGGHNSGNLSVPDEVIYLGPSPIWL